MAFATLDLDLTARATDARPFVRDLCYRTLLEPQKVECQSERTRRGRSLCSPGGLKRNQMGRIVMVSHRLGNHLERSTCINRLTLRQQGMRILFKGLQKPRRAKCMDLLHSAICVPG